MAALIAMGCFVPAAGADGEPNALVSMNTNLGLSAVESRHWDKARHHFAEALNYFADTGGKQPPPGLVFNLALAYDHIPGRQLLAVFWYEIFLALAPNASQAIAIRHRMTELLREFDAMQVAKIDMTEKIFGNIRNLNAERQRLYANETDPHNRRLLKKEIESQWAAVRNAVAALIYMGHSHRARDLLKDFEIALAPDGELQFAFAAIGQYETARSYAVGDADLREVRNLIADITSSPAKVCAKHGRYASLLLLHQTIADAHGGHHAGDYRRDIERPDARAAMMRNFDHADVMARNFVHYTHAIRSLAFARWYYHAFRVSCG